MTRYWAAGLILTSLAFPLAATAQTDSSSGHPSRSNEAREVSPGGHAGSDAGLEGTSGHPNRSDAAREATQDLCDPPLTQKQERRLDTGSGEARSAQAQTAAKPCPPGTTRK
jgi:hypothetical protein